MKNKWRRNLTSVLEKGVYSMQNNTDIHYEVEVLDFDYRSES